MSDDAPHGPRSPGCGWGAPTPTPDVLLVNMPFAFLDLPSIGLSLLRGGLEREGIATEILYLSIRFAERIGEDAYNGICYGTYPHELAGDWVFAEAAFGPQAPGATEGYFDLLRREARPTTSVRPPPSAAGGVRTPDPAETVGKRGASRPWGYLPDVTGELLERLSRARAAAAPFLELWAGEIESRRPAVVGFTSVFIQHVASLALARRIKERLPDTTIVLGGANCEGSMGQALVDRCDHVDAVVSGEADLVFPEMVRRILAGRPYRDLRGVLTSADRGSLAVLQSPAAGNAPEPVANAMSVRDMDALPVPRYDDFFDQLEDSGAECFARAPVLLETSRGCWWGERQHCTFCGLNGNDMAFRSKSPERALAELQDLVERHPGRPIRVVDNILDMAYFEDFIPALAELDLDLEIFYEVKSNLTKSQLRQLRDAGITTIQPGIESFSDDVLGRMRKGVRGLRNIQTVKWCTELGLFCEWNLLWGFPGEDPEEYRRMAGLFPLLSHLQPPVVCIPIRIDRFSPNFFAAEQMGFTSLTPYPAYRHVYPWPEEELSRLAYYFEYEYAGGQDPETYVGPARDAARLWQEIHPRSRLLGAMTAERLILWDSRPVATRPTHVLEGDEAGIYRLFDGIRTRRGALEAWEREGDGSLSPGRLDALLERWLEERILIGQGDRYLALALIPDEPEAGGVRSAAAS